MDEITKLLTKIDLLMTSINSDTTKSKLPEFNSELVQLSKLLWTTKQMYVRHKVAKELKEPELKEKIRKDFELTQDELQKKDEKYKRAKITVDEVEMRMKLDKYYIKIVKDKWEQEELVSYLEPIVDSYNNRSNSVKFESNLNKWFTTNQW